MNPEQYLLVADKLLEAVLQMEQLIDRLLMVHDENSHWLDHKHYDNDPFPPVSG